MLLAFCLSCLFLFAEAQCSLKLVLKDSYGDGWVPNSLSLTSRGTKLALTPASSLAALTSGGDAYLGGGSDGAFLLSVPAGDPVEFTYSYTSTSYPNENSWVLQLANTYAPFSPVVLTSSVFVDSVPTAANIGTVICGPLPQAITDVTIVPGVYAHEVKFDWPSLAVSDADSSVAYTVSYRDIADPDPNNWILLASPSYQSEISAVFPPATTVQVQVVAVNQYGPGTPYLFTYTVPAYATSSVFVKLFDSSHNGWGKYDGFLFLALSNFAFGSLDFPCADNAVCTEIMYEVKIPAGVAYVAKFTYQAPSTGGGDCSWAIYNTASPSSNVICNSEQDAFGPKIQYFQMTVNYPGTATKTSTGTGTSGSGTMTCPGLEPTAGASCTGLTPSGGCAYESSCCCPSEPIASNRYCVSNTYTCSGAPGAVWQAVVQTPVCISDATFTCPSDCPSTAPASKVGTACQAAIACNYPVTCSGLTGCTRTDTYTCAGSATLVWQSSRACTCSNVTSCAAWENLISAVDCCATPPHCETDASSTACLTPTSWTPCAANSGSCGSGTQTRTTYTRQTNKQCLTQTETQSCNIPCPVACVGAWSAYGTCSVTCGTGIKTRKFTVSTPASNNGVPCATVDGTVETAQCDMSACVTATSCNFVIDAFDAYGDGWDTALVRIAYTGGNLTINVPFVDGSTSQKTTQKTFQAPKGGTITFTYVQNQENYPAEASFAVAAGVPSASGAIVRVGSDLLQNPLNLTPDKAPTVTTTLTANCVSCGNASPAFCAGLNRVSCETSQVGNDQCGLCLSGFTSTATSGRTACTDINECTATTSPCGSNAVCTNTVGGFTCSCATGYSLFNGACYSGTCPTYRLRKEWTDLSDAEKDRFVRASVALGKSFWNKVRDIHASVAVAPNNVHADSWFLPWHRGFLYEVENEYMVLPGDLRCTVIPYWDWTRTSEQGSDSAAMSYLKAKIFTNAKSTSGLWLGLGVKASNTWASDATHPFKVFDGYRANWASLSWAGYGTASIYGGALTSSTYAALTNFLVNGAHGALHAYTGGYMGYLNLAAGDPLFFLHHGFLECLHSAWQACKGHTNKDAVASAAWSNSPHPIGQKMPMAVKTSFSWYDLYSNNDLLIKFGTNFLTRVSGTSTAYCPAGSSSGLFAFVEVGKKFAASTYAVGSSVVVTQDNATITTTPTEAGLSYNKKKGSSKGGIRKVSYDVTKPVETALDKQNTEENQAASDIYADAMAAFKKVYKETGNMEQAYSASVDVECGGIGKTYPAGCTTSDTMIKDMGMERMRAQGMCQHICYLRQQGRNKNSYKSNYQKDVDTGKAVSIKSWRHGGSKKTCKGTTPKKNSETRHGGRKRFLDLGEFALNATMTQF